MTLKPEYLVFARDRWEIANVATNNVTGKLQWERRDGSYICDHDTERMVLPMPAKPKGRGQ